MDKVGNQLQQLDRQYYVCKNNTVILQA